MTFATTSKAPGADELGHLVAAEDEDRGLGSHAIFPCLGKIAIYDVLIGLVFHAGGELGHVESEGVRAGYLSLHPAPSVALLVNGVMVFPKSVLLSGTLCPQRHQAGLGAEDGVVAVYHLDVPVVHVGGLDLLGHVKGPASTTGSLEVAVVEDGDRGVGGTENVPFPGVGGRS